MKEYISKENIDNLLERLLDRWNGPEYYTCSIIQDEINDIPTVKMSHGQWVVDEDGNFCNVKCSACGKDYACHYGMLQLQNFSYCPNCGSIMIKENPNGNV